MPVLDDLDPVVALGGIQQPGTNCFEPLTNPENRLSEGSPTSRLQAHLRIGEYLPLVAMYRSHLGSIHQQWPFASASATIGLDTGSMKRIPRVS